MGLIIMFPYISMTLFCTIPFFFPLPPPTTGSVLPSVPYLSSIVSSVLVMKCLRNSFILKQTK